MWAENFTSVTMGPQASALLACNNNNLIIYRSSVPVTRMNEVFMVYLQSRSYFFKRAVSAFLMSFVLLLVFYNFYEQIKL